MSEKELKTQTGLLKQINDRLKESGKDQMDNSSEVASAVETSTASASAQAEKTQTMFAKMFGVLQKMFNFQVMSEKASKRSSVAGAKETEAKERQPVKVDTVKVDGMEGIFGAILGAVFGFVAGFVAELTRVYKAMVISLTKIPALAVELFEAFKGLFTSVRKILSSISRETGLTKAFTNFFASIESVALSIERVAVNSVKSVGKFLGVIEEVTGGFRQLENGVIVSGEKTVRFTEGIRDVILSVRETFRSISAGFKNIGTGIAEFGKIVTDGILKPFKAVGNFVKELKIAEQFVVEAELLTAAFTKIISIATRIASEVMKVVTKTEQVITSIAGVLQNAFLDAQKALRAVEEGVATTSRVVGTAGETATTVANTSGRMAEIFGEFRVLFLNAFEGVKAITSGLSKSKGPIGLVLDAVNGFKSAFTSVFRALQPIGNLVGKLFVPLVVIYETVTEFFEAFTKEGAEAKSFGEKFFEGLKGTLTGIINELVMAPLDLVKSVISWAAGKLGFEQFESMLDAFSFEGAFTRIVDDFVEMMDGFFDYIGDQITSLMDNPLEYAKDMLSSIAGGIMDVISGVNRVIKKAIVKVLNLIPGVNIDTGEDPEESRIEQSEKERRAKAEQSGVVNNPTIGYARADEDKLKDMTPEQLTQMRSDWADYSKVVASIDNELASRLSKPKKVNEATMQQAIRPEPLTPEVVQEATPQVSSPQVAGGSQQAKGLLDELTMREDQLAQTQAKTSYGVGVPFLNAPSNVSNSNNSVVNNTFTQSETSSRDDTDMMFIYRATGTSR